MDYEMNTPGEFEAYDPTSEVQAVIPVDLLDLYEVYSYRHAALILAHSAPEEFAEILEALRQFRLTREMLALGGGNESLIPKRFSGFLRPLGWHETRIHGDLHVFLETKIAGRKSETQTFKKTDYLDGHKIDFVKGQVAFDLEWNSKDQTFDRDLYAARAFYEAGVIAASVLVTRSARLNSIFAEMGIRQKYGASTTWMGKLLPRLNAGRNGGCPVLVFGITERLLID